MQLLPRKGIPVPMVNVSLSDQDKAKVMEIRLGEINKMDKKNLTHSPKSEVRKEVRSIKKQMSELSSGIYISVGALILIILLLIILL